MLDFIKNLFKKQEKEKETVKLGNLGGWFDSRVSNVHDSLNENINVMREKIKAEIEKTKSNLEVLKEAKLQNPNIPMRAKQVMEGNRQSYIKIISNFLDNIKIETDYEILLKFCNDFDISLISLGKSTTRSYHVLKEFFAHQATDIAIDIKNIEQMIKEIKSEIKNSKVTELENIKSKITSVKNKINQKGDFKEELESREAELSGLIKEKENLLKEIESVRNSEDYSNFNSLKTEKELISEEINDNDDIIFQSFSLLNRALRKFSRIILEDEKLLNDYVENPVNTLLKDKELKIIKILGSLGKNLTEDKLGLDEKKKNKTLAEIKKLSKDFFVDFMNSHDKLIEHMRVIEEEIEHSEINNKYKALNERLNMANNNLENVGNNVENLKQSIGKIDIEKMKSNLEKEIKEMLKIEISVV